MLRKNLNDHLTNKCPRRQFPCQHCNENGEYEERTTTHLQTCPKVIVQCPNDKCKLSIPRCEVATHRSTCGYERVPCKYAEVGCKETPLRKDLKTHEEDNQIHIRFMIETVLELRREVKQHATSFRMTNYQRHKKVDDCFYSPPFYTTLAGYKMCIRVDDNGWFSRKGTHVSVYAYLMKGDNDDYLTWPFTGSVTVELLNQLEDKNHHKHTIGPFPADKVASKRVVEGERGTNGLGTSQFIPHNELDYNSDNNCQYLKDNTLIFRVSVQVPDYKPWLECTV